MILNQNYNCIIIVWETTHKNNKIRFSYLVNFQKIAKQIRFCLVFLLGLRLSTVRNREIACAAFESLVDYDGMNQYGRMGACWKGYDF